MIDTNVAIKLRDGDPIVRVKFDALDDDILMSIVTHVELEGGVHRDPALSAVRRARLDLMLDAFAVLPFDSDAVSAYGAIVAAAGYSRPRLLDRMIAAQALVVRAPVITMNEVDFRDVPGLTVIGW